MKRFLTLIFILITLAHITHAQQIMGEVVDTNGYAIPYVSVMYKGNHVASVTDIEGKFTIDKYAGWMLTFSSVGLQSKTIKVDEHTPNYLKIVLKEEAKNLKEVVVRSRRGRYSRKNNPAVELMRCVIEANKRSHLENYPYYQYHKYQKLTLSINDIQPKDIEKGFYSKSPWLLDQIETSEYNNKLVLPVSVDETVTQHVYRKEPVNEMEKEKKDKCK